MFVESWSGKTIFFFFFFSTKWLKILSGYDKGFSFVITFVVKVMMFDAS